MIPDPRPQTPDPEPPPLGVTAVMLPELDFHEQIELCGRLGVTHYVFRPRIISDDARGKPYHSHGNHKFDLTPQRLIDEGPTLRRQLESGGLVPFCTVPAGTADDDDATIKLHLEGAAAVDARRLRVTPPIYPRGLFDYPAYLDRAVNRYRAVCDLAKPYGIKIVIEMHSDTAAASAGLAYNLIRSFDPQDLGVILDLPNMAREGFIAPDLALSMVRPWLDHVHIGGLRRTAGEYDAEGFRDAAMQMCALEESDLHIPTWIKTIAAAKPDAPLIIEDYRANMPGGLRLEQNARALKRLMKNNKTTKQ